MTAAPRIRRPVIIVSTPRSGSTLLFETLSLSADLWTVGGESHNIIEGLPQLHPRTRGWHSNQLAVEDADLATKLQLRKAFGACLQDRTGRRPQAGEHGLRLLEKTPRNALRIPFLAETFPKASFVYLYRNAVETLASMLAGWRSGRFVSYRSLPDWPGPAWSFLLVPGWRDLIGEPLGRIVVHQWWATTRILLADLARLPPERRICLRYDRLVQSPQTEIARLCDRLAISWDQPWTESLPLSVSTLTPPRPDKWREQVEEFGGLLAPVHALDEQARAVVDGAPAPA